MTSTRPLQEGSGSSHLRGRGKQRVSSATRVSGALAHLPQERCPSIGDRSLELTDRPGSHWARQARPAPPSAAAPRPRVRPSQPRPCARTACPALPAAGPRVGPAAPTRTWEALGRRRLNLLGRQHRQRGVNAVGAIGYAQIRQQARGRECDPALSFRLPGRLWAIACGSLHERYTPRSQ